jgi:hypothetical protein
VEANANRRIRSPSSRRKSPRPKRPLTPRSCGRWPSGTLQGVIAQSVVIENLTFYGTALPAQPPAAVDDENIHPCPYLGLAYFGPRDSAWFFGREAAIMRLKAAVMRDGP